MIPPEGILTLEEALSNTVVEDIVLAPAGLSYYARGRWTGPYPCEDARPANLQSLAAKIADSASLTLGLTQPTVDTFLAFREDITFRAHVAISPLILSGPEITLRRLAHKMCFPLEGFFVDAHDGARAATAVRAGKSVLIAGRTGSGKSTLLTSLLSLLAPEVRVLVLEDSPEIPLPTPLSTKLLARNDRYGFRSGARWTLEHLVFEALRMRPDRIVIGECRGPEARAIAIAQQTGHAGLMTTLHAGSCAGALDRFRQLKQDPGLECDWDVVLYLEENSRGERRVTETLYRAES